MHIRILFLIFIAIAFIFGCTHPDGGGIDTDPTQPGSNSPQFSQWGFFFIILILADYFITRFQEMGIWENKNSEQINGAIIKNRRIEWWSERYPGYYTHGYHSSQTIDDAKREIVYIHIVLLLWFFPL